MNEREELDERYLEAQLREELGIHPDLSEDVLRRVYAQPPRRIIPPPRRKPVWQPLAAAAAVLVVSGLATFALVKVLPQQSAPEQAQREQPVKEESDAPAKPEVTPVRDEPAKTPEPKDAPEPELDDEPQPDEQVEKPTPEPEKEDESVTDVTPKPPEDQVENPSDNESPHPWRDWTDPPESWPGRIKDTDTTAPQKRPVLVSSWNGEGIKINGKRAEPDDEVQICAGDHVWVKGFADFTLVDGTLLRVDGEITFEGDEKAISVQLNDGALYADTAAGLRVGGDSVSAVVNGLAVVEERLRSFDVYCLRGHVTAGAEMLAAGFQARLKDGSFEREKPTAWADVQREFKFLRESPARTLVREDLDNTPGTLFGGAIEDGVLRGETDSETGLGFYLREPYSIGEGDVVRFRFRVEKACEMILQFGTVENANWRHKIGGVKAGEWIVYEVPLRELYKTTDVAQKAAPGLRLKFFQLHPEDAEGEVRIDWVEIARKP